jgi:hypothetical protein
MRPLSAMERKWAYSFRIGVAPGGGGGGRTADQYHLRFVADLGFL